MLIKGHFYSIKTTCLFPKHFDQNLFHLICKFYNISADQFQGEVFSFSHKYMSCMQYFLKNCKEICWCSHRRLLEWLFFDQLKNWVVALSRLHCTVGSMSDWRAKEPEVWYSVWHILYLTNALPVPKMTIHLRNGQNMRVAVMADKLSLT